MKLTKRTLSAVLALVLILAICAVPVSSEVFYYSFIQQLENAYSPVAGVNYSAYTLTSGENGHVENASVLQFNTDEYIPMVFSGTAGTAGTLNEQYKLATEKYGYEVAGIINGSFFSMDTAGTGTYGTLVHSIVSNGVITSSHAGDADNAVAFNSDGSFDVVNTKIDYSLAINGINYPNAIYYINKTTGTSTWSAKFYYFDTNCGDKALTVEKTPGFEILCKKVNNSDLIIGGTLTGKVVSVTADTYGGAIGKDEFILFAKSNSNYATMIKTLKADDIIKISASETVSGSKDITEKANSMISNVGWYVKNGEDQTQKVSTIGTHSVTLCARWTAFGRKADGSYVFFTVDGGSTSATEASVTQRDVAKAMIELGCVDVIRMDGGGSVAMYVCDDGSGQPGFKMVSKSITNGRAVADCIMIVKRSSIQSGVYKAKIAETLPAAQAKLLEEEDEALEKACNDAVKAAMNENSVDADHRRALLALEYAATGKSKLKNLVTDVAGIKFTDYSEYALTEIRAAYAKAVDVLADESATADDVDEVYAPLAAAYAKSGELVVDGETYKTVDTGVYLTSVNAKIETDNSNVFTPGFDLKNGANLNWTRALVFEWNDSLEAYVLKKTVQGNGPSIYNITGATVAENGLVIGVHGTPANKALANAGKVGDTLKIYGVDIQNQTIGVAAYFTFEAPKQTIIPKENSGITFNEQTKQILGVSAGLTLAQLNEKFDLPLSVFTASDKALASGDVVGSGMYVNNADGSKVYIVVLGDVSGDGIINSKDYMMLKRCVMGTYKLEGALLAAGDIDAKDGAQSKDYLMLKRHVLGSYDIFATK